MKYTEQEIINLYKLNIERSRQLLGTLDVAEGREPAVMGLNGWVFEETVRYCLQRELKELGVEPPISEQAKISGRAKADLLVGNIAIEIKVSGLYSGSEGKKYCRYRDLIEKNGWVYFYLSISESYQPYKHDTQNAFGHDRTFFLSDVGDWSRFVKEVFNMLNHL